MLLIPNLNCDLCCHTDTGSGRGQGRGQGQGQGWDQERVPKVGKPFSFRGLNASIFLIFFFNMPRILRVVHFFASEHPKITSTGRTARTTASTTIAGTTFSLVLSPAGITGKFIMPSGTSGHYNHL